MDLPFGTSRFVDPLRFLFWHFFPKETDAIQTAETPSFPQNFAVFHSQRIHVRNIYLHFRLNVAGLCQSGQRAVGTLLHNFTGLAGVRFPPGWEGLLGRGHLQKLRALPASSSWTLLRHGGLLRPVCRHYAIQGLVIHDFFIFGQCVCGSSDEGIVVALADDYSAPFSRRSAEGLGEDTHEDYHHVARSYRTFNYNAPVSGAEWAQSPYEYENTTGPAEGPDELDPDLEVEEESWKLHQQAVEYQKHQEEELKELQWICGETRLSGKRRRSCSKFPQSWVTQEWHCSSLCSQETHGQRRYGVWVREIRVVQPLYSIYSFVPNESSCKCKMSCRFELTIPSRRHLSCFWRVTFKSMVTADPRGLDTNSDSLCRIRKK